MKDRKDLPRVAKLINDRIEELKGTRNQREIALMAGFKNQNMITLLKQGDVKLAIDRVDGLAKALDLDPKILLPMALEQFYSSTLVNTLYELIGSPLTNNEAEILGIIREASGGSDPKLTEKRKEALTKAFSN